MSKVLEGITVIEQGTFITGPAAGMLLGDLGANVIKVEMPGKGDPFRAFKGGLYSPHYQTYNRNKRSIALNTKEPEDLATFDALIRDADVYIQNFRPGTAERLGAGEERLRELNPRLIYCAISGFGNDGPYAGRPSYDTVAQAASGFLKLLVNPASASAVETIHLTVGSSHPTTIPWVGMIPQVFIPRVNEILAEEGEYEVRWTEAYAGQLYGTNATLTSIQDGIADIGWVFSYLEPSRMPLAQISAYTPFTTSDPELMLDVMNDLVRSVPEFRAEWEDHDLVFLGATASDTYDIYTNFPVESLDDLKGARISAPGVLGVWLEPVGAVPVDGTLASYYTDIQTGVSQGVVGLATGNLPARIYEVAPYVTQVNLGVVFSGGLAINQFTWDGLPEPVQEALMEAGETYTRAHGRDLAERYESSLERMVELGADQSTPVQVQALSDAERQQWIDGMPGLAQQWVERNEGRGLPARELLSTYMDAMRERGHEPELAWDRN